MQRRSDHRGAAARHEQAAANHDRAARFWDERQDVGRAQLQRELAEYERQGADLERRWGSMIDSAEAPEAPHEASEEIRRHTRQSARRAAGLLEQLAMALEKTADLAVKHAERGEDGGRPDDAEREHHAASRAREAAERARRQAEEWLRISEDRKP